MKEEQEGDRWRKERDRIYEEREGERVATATMKEEGGGGGGGKRPIAKVIKGRAKRIVREENKPSRIETDP